MNQKRIFRYVGSFLTLLFLTTGVPSLFGQGGAPVGNAWMHFSPTAQLIEGNHAIELTIWPKNLVDTDIRGRYLRYDARYAMIQGGIQVYGNTKGDEVHSSYANLRYQVLNDAEQPVFLALGARGRLYWNEKNSDFTNKDSEIEDRNKRRDQFTLFAAVTGRVPLPEFPTTLNLFVSNQSISGGGKVMVYKEVVGLLAEYIYYNFEDPLVTGDFAFGVELYNPDVGGIFNVTYQVEPEQTLLGFKVVF